MNTTDVLLDPQRLSYATEEIRKYGAHISPGVQKDILRQHVSIGMSPYEAKLAGGAYLYKVQADFAVWPVNADPINVIARQSLQPDNSKIWLTFENVTQFSSSTPTQFIVYFEHGKAVEIKKLTAQDFN